MEHRDKTFADQVVHQDGNKYIKCRFERCKMVFSASDTVQMEECTYVSCDWALEGAAQLTLQYMMGLYHVPGMKDFLETTFQNIRGHNPRRGMN